MAKLPSEERPPAGCPCRARIGTLGAFYSRMGKNEAK
jgi:hypothetical protein